MSALKIISGLCVAYLLYCGLLFFLQRQVLFPRYLMGGAPEKIPEVARREILWFEINGGKKVEAWFIPPQNAKRPFPVVMFAHGNGELIDYWPDELSRFGRMGMGLMLVEYPGYGRSEGSPSQQGITDVFVQAYDHLLSRKDVDAARIVLFGRSLGGGAACSLANHRPSAALVLMSTFTSVRSFALRYLAPGFLIRDPFDNLSTVASYTNPMLIFHGRYDEVIPYRHGLSLHQAAPQSKMITYDSGHNDCPLDWNIFWRDIEKFFRDAKILKD